MRDVWLDDTEPGCLECGALVFRASKIPGVCVSCINEVSSASFSSIEYEFYHIKNGEDTDWVEN
jgi:hypothetical protein